MVWGPSLDSSKGFGGGDGSLTVEEDPQWEVRKDFSTPTTDLRDRTTTGTGSGGPACDTDEVVAGSESGPRHRSIHEVPWTEKDVDDVVGRRLRGERSGVYV